MFGLQPIHLADRSVYGNERTWKKCILFGVFFRSHYNQRAKCHSLSESVQPMSYEVVIRKFRSLYFKCLINTHGNYVTMRHLQW